MAANLVSKQLKNNLEVSIDIDSNVSKTIETSKEKLEFTETNLMPIKEKRILLKRIISKEERLSNNMCEFNALEKVQENGTVVSELHVEGSENLHMIKMETNVEEENSKCMAETTENPTQRFILDVSENEMRIPIENETVNNDPVTESDSVNLVCEEVVENAEQAVLQVVEIQENGNNLVASETTESLNNFEERSDSQETLQDSFLKAINSNKLRKNMCGLFRYFLGISILIIVIIIIVKFYSALKRDFIYHGTKS